MTAKKRLSGLEGIPASVVLPSYEPAAHGHGILHLGIGAFHKAHQAAYTDTALASRGGDWRIIAASLRGSAAAEALNPQNGLYTLIERGPSGTSARVIGSVSHVIAASETPAALIEALTDPMIRIVSLTVTEKAYGIARFGDGLDLNHPTIVSDLDDPDHPRGVIGYLVLGLHLRRQAGISPFTVLCCDNLPENGRLLRKAVLAFARRIDAKLAEWIANSVAFPSTMVDRITPATTQATLDEACAHIGRVDLAAVETEPFSQWVIEDDFCNGRPAWEEAGAIFVKDVRPYEDMKLRMLNGTHSLMAYAGFLSDRIFVRDVMADPDLSRLVTRHLTAAAATLAPLPGIDLDLYGLDLKTRFSNPAIAHQTYQIAMDGSQKLPQRIFAPACDAAKSQQDLQPFAFATAAWMRYCLGQSDGGTPYDLRDPLEPMIRERVAAAHGRADQLCGNLMMLPDLVPAPLSSHSAFWTAVIASLDTMLSEGMSTAIHREAQTIALP